MSGQRPGDAGQAALTVGQRAGAGVGEVSQAHHVDREVDVRRSARVRRGAIASTNGDHHRVVVAATSRFSRTVRSSKSSTDWNVRTSPCPGALVGWQRVDAIAAEVDASVRGNETAERVDRGGLARAVRADQSHDPIGLHRERDVVDRAQATEVDAELDDLEQRAHRTPRRRVKPRRTATTSPSGHRMATAISMMPLNANW